ncbi:MAG: HD domain-containing protein [Patescibacteria group bacterium]
MSTLIRRSRALMHRKTIENGAPTWALTELAVAKGEELAKKYNVDRELVVVALYLAHVIFSKKINGRIQGNHEELSARLAEKYLKRWKVDPRKTMIILNAIRAHHEKVKAESKVAEVMKSAECFKFITVQGAVIYLHDLGGRDLSLSDAVRQVRRKAKQKLGYIGLPGIKQEALRSFQATNKLLDSLE